MRLTILVLVLAALASVGLLLTGYGLFTENQRTDGAVVDSRPNIVFVMTDDLDERSMEDLPGIRDIMGSKGTTFENAYVTNSLCCPSRVTILRGQYPHNHRILGNSPPEGGEPKFRNLGLDKSTIATWLDGDGYRTKHIGKYMNSYKDLYVPPGWDEWFALNRGRDASEEVNEDGHRTTLGGHSAYVFADKASDFIRKSSASPEPFFVMVNTVAPHTPPEVDTRYQDRFATTPLPKPPNFDEADISDKPKWLQRYPRLSPDRTAMEEEEYRNRLRSMLSVEDLLKQTIATLQETGELDNTYVFFTSDHGYHMGNHRLASTEGLGKKTPYEEDIGVPLMVRGPGVPAGAVRQELVLNNDFAPTLADLAGASTPAFVDGSSFAPLLTGSPPPAWRRAFLEEGWHSSGRTFSPPTHKGVHTQEHMFIEYVDTGDHELYDLQLDPYQLETMPQAGNEQLYSALETRLNSLRECSGDACRDAEWAANPPTAPTDTTAPHR
jgi:N-acetylglucosamine-6-sulfatase